MTPVYDIPHVNRHQQPAALSLAGKLEAKQRAGLGHGCRALRHREGQKGTNDGDDGKSESLDR